LADDRPLRVPNFKVEVDGKEISGEIRSTVEGVAFEEEINTASMFTIRLSTANLEKGSWRYLDLADFKLGSEVKLYMGMDKVEPMIVSEVTSLEPSFGKEQSIIEVRGFDRLHRLRFGKKKRTFAGAKDSDIASTLAGDWGLSADAEDTGTVHPSIYQNNLSDFEFLLERAKRIRYEVMVDDKKLIFRKARENDAVSLTLEYRVDIDEFSCKLSTRYEANEVVVQGWDFMKKEAISAKAKEGNEVSKMSADETGTKMAKSAFSSSSSAVSTVIGEYLVDASDAEKLAIARYNTQLVEFVTGEGRCQGIPGLRAGKNIDIKGLGRFSGTYYVTSTTHIIGSHGYDTSFKVRRVGV
jgi:phage protein D